MCHVTKLSILQGFLTVSLHCVKEKTQKKYSIVAPLRASLSLAQTTVICPKYYKNVANLCSTKRNEVLVSNMINHGLPSLPYKLFCAKINFNLSQKFRIVMAAKRQPIYQLPKFAGPSRLLLVFIVCTLYLGYITLALPVFIVPLF